MGNVHNTATSKNRQIAIYSRKKWFIHSTTRLSFVIVADISHPRSKTVRNPQTKGDFSMSRRWTMSEVSFHNLSLCINRMRVHWMWIVLWVNRELFSPVYAALTKREEASVLNSTPWSILIQFSCISGNLVVTIPRSPVNWPWLKLILSALKNVPKLVKRKPSISLSLSFLFFSVPRCFPFSKANNPFSMFCS